MIKFIIRTQPSLAKIQWFSFSDLNKKPNLYTMLNVKQGATLQQIRYHYFKEMSKYKPKEVGANEELKHSKLLNQAFAILSNQKLRAKYDQQNGFINKENKAKPKTNMSKNSEMDKDYNEARRGFSAVLGDKKTRLQEKLLGVAAISMLIGTVLLIVNGKSYKKTVLANAPQNKKPN